MHVYALGLTDSFKGLQYDVTKIATVCHSTFFLKCRPLVEDGHIWSSYTIVITLVPCNSACMLYMHALLHDNLQCMLYMHALLHNNLGRSYILSGHYTYSFLLFSYNK